MNLQDLHGRHAFQIDLNSKPWPGRRASRGPDVDYVYGSSGAAATASPACASHVHCASACRDSVQVLTSDLPHAHYSLGAHDAVRVAIHGPASAAHDRAAACAAAVDNRDFQVRLRISFEGARSYTSSRAATAQACRYCRGLGMHDPSRIQAAATGESDCDSAGSARAALHRRPSTSTRVATVSDSTEQILSPAHKDSHSYLSTASMRALGFLCPAVAAFTQGRHRRLGRCALPVPQCCR